MKIAVKGIVQPKHQDKERLDVYSYTGNKKSW
jgi:hypothetical protein